MGWCELPSVSQARSGQDAEAVLEQELFTVMAGDTDTRGTGMALGIGVTNCGKRCVFLWQSTTLRAFSASLIAICASGIMVCLARLVGDVSSFSPEPLITVQAPWDLSEASDPPGRPVDKVNHRKKSCVYD